MTRILAPGLPLYAAMVFGLMLLHFGWAEGAFGLVALIAAGLTTAMATAAYAALHALLRWAIR